MSSNYNSRYTPAEACLHNNELKLIRKSQEIDDLLNNQIIIDLQPT